MKTLAIIKQTLLALTIALSIISCKKDKKDPDPSPPLAEAKVITLSDLKALSTGASVKVPDARKISGIVISDVSSKNIDSKTVILQDVATQLGIIITFDAAQSYVLGDQLEVNISGQTLAQVNGEVVLQNIPSANAKKTGTGTIAAKATTIAEIKTNNATWNGTLVTIAATDLSGTTATYSGTLTLKDASGTLNSLVLAGAFTNIDLPPSVTSVTGIVRISGTDTRIDIRKTADVVTGEITRVITEMFENVTPFAPFGTNPDELQRAGFTTSVLQWAADTQERGYYLIPGATYDPGYTKAGRSYIYIPRSGTLPDGSLSIGYNILPNQGNTILKGVKTISVTFAGSQGTSFIFRSYAAPEPNDNITGDIPFTEGTDFVQIGITTGNFRIYLPELLKKSEKITKVGQFYTFTWTVPTREELIAAGLDEGEADNYLNNPSFQIINLSSYRSAGTDFKGWSPILLDKVVFGF